MAYGSFNAGPGKAPDEDVVRTDQIGIPGGIGHAGCKRPPDREPAVGSGQLQKG